MNEVFGTDPMVATYALSNPRLRRFLCVPGTLAEVSADGEGIPMYEIKVIDADGNKKTIAFQTHDDPAAMEALNAVVSFDVLGAFEANPNVYCGLGAWHVECSGVIPNEWDFSR